MKNFSASCERNKEAILNELKLHFSNVSQVLELGSLSGQHAIHFSEELTHLQWQPSDLIENIIALNQNISEYNITNCRSPLAIDVAQYSQWPDEKYDAIYTANTLHIMSWQHVEALFEHLPKVCNKNALLCIYGPFKYQGHFTSTSNAEFQQWLQNRDVNSGIRDFEKVNELARAQGFLLQSDKTMPANNQLIVWKMTI